jgi:hypothetical protein
MSPSYRKNPDMGRGIDLVSPAGLFYRIMGINMKKVLFICFFLALLFSCGSQNYIRISNNSAYDVSFQLKGYNGGTYVLLPGEFDDFKPEMYLESFEASPPRVSFRENDEFDWEFYNNPEIALKINNMLSETVELSALGCMENEPLMIDSGLSEYVIYTSKPDFKATINEFPVDASFLWDEPENSIYLTIH